MRAEHDPRLAALGELDASVAALEVEQHQLALAAVPPLVGEHGRGIALEPDETTEPQRRRAATQRHEPTMQMEQRARILLGARHVERGEVGMHGQPGLDRREATVGPAVPGHRRTAAVPTAIERPEVLALGVDDLLALERGLGEAELVAIVEEGGAA